MHPAPSVILFTTLSGFGFGLLVFLGLGAPVVIGWTAFAYFTVAYGTAVGGLMSSAFHLGHPERALKAFTQWRSSWLSREAWLSVLTLLAFGIYAIGEVFFFTRIGWLGWIGAALAVTTVLSTSMIYAQLRTIPRWHSWTTPCLYLLTGLAGGALAAGEAVFAQVLLALAGTMQVLTFIDGDRRLAASGSTIATATGLGGIGRVRAFEPPHRGENYLTREMVFRVGRKHAARLRLIGVVLMAGLPLLLVVLSSGRLVLALAALVHLVGVAVCRWLFFAEAEHVVSLYYGR